VKIKQTVKPVYKGHSREPENVVFMNSGSLYTKLYVLFINGGKWDGGADGWINWSTNAWSCWEREGYSWLDWMAGNGSCK
jgi:hypothetical protein